MPFVFVHFEGSKALRAVENLDGSLRRGNVISVEDAEFKRAGLGNNNATRPTPQRQHRQDNTRYQGKAGCK